VIETRLDTSERSLERVRKSLNEERILEVCGLGTPQEVQEKIWKILKERALISDNTY
jgi:hypothetical protein